MNKKLVVLLVLLLTLGLTNTFAEMAIGGAGTFSDGPGAVLTLKVPKVPLMFGIGATLGTNFSLSLSGDYWVYNQHLLGALGLYLGPGAYFNLSTGNTMSFEIGARVPVGIFFYPIKPLEVYLELAPKVGIPFNGGSFPAFGLQGQLGLRFWFNTL